MMTPTLSEPGLTHVNPASTYDAESQAAPQRLGEAMSQVPALPGAQLLISALLMTAVATLIWLGLNVLAGDRMLLILLTASSASAILYLAHSLNAESIPQLLVDLLAFGAIISIAMTGLSSLSVHLAATLMVHAVWAAFMYTQSSASTNRQRLFCALFSFCIAVAMVTLLAQ